MNLTQLTFEQKEKLFINRKKFISKFLNNEKINKEKALEVIRFVYSLIKKDMPKVYKVGDPLSAQKLANKLKGTKNKYYSFGTYLTIYWASFYAYYETYVDFGIITKEKFPKYFELRKFIESNIFMTIEFEKAIILIEKPIRCLKNENGLHCLTGMAIEWENGYGQFYINGRNISKENFEKIRNNTYTTQDFFNETNEEKKSVCLQFMIELYGDNYIAEFFKSVLKEVDTYVDKKDEKYLNGTTKGMNIGVYTLFKGSLNNYNIAYCRVYCPSTDRMFYLGVEPIHTNAKDAIASLYTIPRKLKTHIQSISRQGEIFSTTLDKKGLDKAKNLSKEDLQDTISVNGDFYFNNMKYEY